MERPRSPHEVEVQRSLLAPDGRGLLVTVLDSGQVLGESWGAIPAVVVEAHRVEHEACTQIIVRFREEPG